MSKKEKSIKTDVKRRRKKRPMKSVFSVIIIFIACFLIWSAVEDIIMTIQLKKEISQSQQLVDELETQKASLAKEKSNLENPEYVKRFVRGKFLVSKQGEQVFKLPSKNDNDSSDD